MNYLEDPVKGKLNSLVAIGFTIVAELFINITIAEQIFSHHPWTFHRMVTLFGLAVAALIVAIQWYVVRSIFTTLNKQLTALEPGTGNDSMLTPAFWAPLAGLRTLTPFVAFILTMAFRGVLDN
jgi:divalent metal cation (Fe/Co/Zn/Cd) transporter